MKLILILKSVKNSLVCFNKYIEDKKDVEYSLEKLYTECNNQDIKDIEEAINELSTICNRER